MEHTEGRSRGGENIGVLGVNETNGESIDTEILAETTGNMNLVLQPGEIFLVFLVLFAFLLVEPHLCHRQHLLLLVERNGVNLIADQVDFSVVGPLEAHKQAFLAQHSTSGVVWLQKQESLWLRSIHASLIIGILERVQGWLEVVLGLSLSSADEDFRFDVQVCKKR